MTALYAAGAKSAFSGVAIHPYAFPALPGDESQTWTGWNQMLRMRAIMVHNGDEAKQVWITEMGAPTGGVSVESTLTDRHYADSPDHVDEELQATTVTTTFTIADRSSWIHAVYWYGLVDIPAHGPGNEAFFGLLRADGTPKAAYAAFQAAIESLS